MMTEEDTGCNLRNYSKKTLCILIPRLLLDLVRLQSLLSSNQILCTTEPPRQFISQDKGVGDCTIRRPSLY